MEDWISSWSEYFASEMVKPEIIKGSDLFYETRRVASSHASEDSELIGRFMEESGSIHYQGEKYVFVERRDDEVTGYILYLYKKIKKDGDNEALFVSRIGSFIWFGKFDDSKKGLVFDHIYNVSSMISSSTRE